MPICTSCTHAVPYLYTVYASADNLRLEKCPDKRCGAFADPYVEHSALTVLLDLVLLKLGVYRHLLYNRGAPPRRLAGATSAPMGTSGGAAAAADDDDGAGANTKKKGEGDGGTGAGAGAVDEGVHAAAVKETARWALLVQLGATLVLIDAFIRYTYLHPDGDAAPTRWTRRTALAFLRVLLGTAAETLAFHGGITFTCAALMRLLALVHGRFPSSSPSTSSIRREFRLSLISFSLFYSSITKLFLLFLLTIWVPAAPPLTPLPPWAPFGSDFLNGTVIERAVSLLDDAHLDRAWVVRNVLGGMCAGFGLRVILDIHPIFSTIIILSGWAAKTAVATLLSAWVGGSQQSGEAWLAYSIP